MRYVAAAVFLAFGCSSPEETDTTRVRNGDPLADACQDALDSLYEAPSGLTPFSAAVRGEVVGCAPFASYSAAEVKSRLAGVPDVVVESGGISVYLVQYRTAREPADVGGLSTALVYIPEYRMDERVPIVLAAHGSVGIANHCAPSKLVLDPAGIFVNEYFDALYLAWAARGLPVVAPDYAGLGTPGIHDYSNWFDPARSAIDGVRALHGMLDSTTLDGGVLVQGHSQGGGIALTVASLPDELPELQVRAVVATTPAWRLPITLVDAFSLSAVSLAPQLRAAGALGVYAALANLTNDETQWASAFHEDVREATEERLTTLCYDVLVSSLDTPAAGYVPPGTVGELVDSTFVQQLKDCTVGANCNTLAGRFVERTLANKPSLTASGPPVLVTGSTADESLTPGQLGCVADGVESDGAPLDVCIHTGFDHMQIVPGLHAYSMQWALAAARGTKRPTCLGDGERAGCSVF